MDNSCLWIKRRLLAQLCSYIWFTWASSCKTEAQQCFSKESIVDRNSCTLEREKGNTDVLGYTGMHTELGILAQAASTKVLASCHPHGRQRYARRREDWCTQSPKCFLRRLTILSLSLASPCNEKACLLRKMTTKYCKNPALCHKGVHFQIKEKTTVALIAHYTFL